MAHQRRIERINQLLKEELARLIRREVKDPRVSSVTITGVDTTEDLRHATVHVRTLGDRIPVAEAIEGLRSAAGYLRGSLGRELHLRRIPEFVWEADRTLERVARIEALLDEVKAEGGDDEDDAEQG